MVCSYRLVRKCHATRAFSGEGSALYGGRWTLPGFEAVYTSDSRALAALETLVHLERSGAQKYSLFACEFPEDLVETLALAECPAGWNQEPPCSPSQSLGSSWISESRSAVLRVPSILVPEENNYILNPDHPDFGNIMIGKPRTFSFDPRILGIS